MKQLMFAIGLVAALSLSAETFVLTKAPSSLDDWKNGEFYEGGVAPTGVETDTIATKKENDLVIELDGTNETPGENNATFEFLGGMRGLLISNAVLRVTVPAGHVATFNCAVWDNSTRTGTLEKYGEGELYLAARQKLSTTSTSPADFESHLHVFEGTVRLTRNAESAHQYHPFHSVTIEKPAKVITLFNECVWQMRGLYGEGMITNEESSACKMYVCEGKEKYDGGEFKGVIGGNVAVEARGCKIVLSGTNSTFSGGVSGTYWDDHAAEVHLVDFGEKSRGFSSAGSGKAILGLGSNPYVYAGEGQTTDRDFQLNYVNSVLDAGTNGNLVYKGILRRWDGTKRNPSLFLVGDNREPCTFAARGLGTGDALDDFSRTVDGQTETFNYYFGKRGTGEWHFPFTGYFRNTGVFAVENGTLSFETIDQAGQLTSLGYSTRLFENKEITHPSTEPQLPYAFLLGSDKTDETGLMECTTNLAQQCTDRPFGLKGRGGFVANMGLVKYANVFGVGSGTKTLLLDGTNTLGSEVHDVADRKAGSSDTAVVSVEKNGSGTWVLGGDQTFSGSLTVNGGTLIVRRPAQTYRRYRLMVRNMAKANYSIVNINELGLFSSDNKSQTMNLKRAASYVTMQPGECAAGWNRTYNRNYQTPPDPFEQLFDGRRYCTYGDAGDKSWHALNGGFRYAPVKYASEGVNESNPTNGNPYTWMPIDMYLADDALPIDHFDIQTAVNAASNPGNVPNELQLLASVDGVHWDEVSAVETVTTLASATYTWLSSAKTGGGLTDGGSTPLASYTHADGWKVTNSVPTKVFSLLENVGAVTVANGATLKYEGAADGAPALSQVKLAAGATGSIDGFAFAEEGTFEIDAMDAGSVSVGVTLPNATGLGNVANWQVKVGGVLKPKYSVKATEDGFTVDKGGLAIILR